MAIVIVLAVVAGGAYLVLNGGRQFPSAWDPRVDPIAQWVAKERKLDFDHPVEVEFLSDAAYTAASTGGDVAEPDASKSAAMDDSIAQLRALGLVEGTVDLNEASNTLSDSGTLAYYDPGTKKVYVRGTEITPDLRVTLAHELTHVLQDQNFGLERITDLPEGKAATLRALAEGDATRIEDIYVANVLSDDERAAYEKSSQESGNAATETIDAKVPAVIVATFAAPYILGPELITYLDGDKDIDEALTDPPGEEVLFDPTVNGTSKGSDEPLDVAAPSGTKSIESGEFGPTTWYLMLASRMEPTVALRAAVGLAGDGYAVYRKDEKVCVDVQAQGDSEIDIVELTTALDAWIAKSPTGTASAEVVDGTLRFSSCDPGADAAAGGAITVDMLQLPVLRTELYRGAATSGADAIQAACFADTILEQVTFEQISSGFLNSPDFAPIAQRAGSTCG